MPKSNKKVLSEREVQLAVLGHLYKTGWGIQDRTLNKRMKKGLI